MGRTWFLGLTKSGKEKFGSDSASRCRYNAISAHSKIGNHRKFEKFIINATYKVAAEIEYSKSNKQLKKLLNKNVVPFCISQNMCNRSNYYLTIKKVYDKGVLVIDEETSIDYVVCKTDGTPKGVLYYIIKNEGYDSYKVSSELVDFRNDRILGVHDGIILLDNNKLGMYKINIRDRWTTRKLASAKSWSSKELEIMQSKNEVLMLNNDEKTGASEIWY